jgi:iron(III) transport system substrate-binding protein
LFVTFARFALLIIVLVGGSANAQARITKLMIYSPHGPEILTAAKEGFQKKFPEVEIDWVYEGAQSLYQRLGRERSDPVADIWWGGPQFTFIQAAEDGLLQPYEPSWSKAVKRAYRDEKHRWYGDLQTPLSIFFSVLPGAGDTPPPKDWDDLLDPLYKGKIAARYPLTSGTMRSLVLALIDRQLRAGRSLDEALAWLKKWDANIAAYTPHSVHMFRLVGKGVLKFGLWNVPEVKLRATQGYNLDFVYPESGMPVLVDCIGLVRKLSVEPMAKEFYEYVTSKEFAETLTRQPFNRIHTREDLPDSARPSYLKNKAFKVMPTDWRRIAEMGEDWVERIKNQKILDDGKLTEGKK